MRIKVGRLGLFTFPAGYYVYTGSALRGLDARIARHQRRDKKHHWHIDYLLRYALVEKVFTHITDEKKECHLNREVFNIDGARPVVAKFGASDCKCPSHLAYFGTKPELESIQGLEGKGRIKRVIDSSTFKVE